MTKFNEAGNFLLPNEKQRVKAAVFTAHPDDETVWMGGTILSKADWSWEIFVATHQANDERGIEFQKAVCEYRVQCGIRQLNYHFIDIMQDTDKEDHIDTGGVTNRLDEIELRAFDIIFTHNVDGEYGHANHRTLGDYFKHRSRDRLNMWHFLCPAIQNPRRKEVGEYVESLFLSPAMMAKKTSVFQCAYTSQHYLWTNLGDVMRFQFCSGVEMFTRY